MSGCDHCNEAGHPDCMRRFGDLERRMVSLEDSHKAQAAQWITLSQAVNDVKVALASLNGRLAGYLVAASLLGTVVAFIAQKTLGN